MDPNRKAIKWCNCMPKDMFLHDMACIYPKCLDNLTPYHTCRKLLTSSSNYTCLDV